MDSDVVELQPSEVHEAEAVNQEDEQGDAPFLNAELDPEDASVDTVMSGRALDGDPADDELVSDALLADDLLPSQLLRSEVLSPPSLVARLPQAPDNSCTETPTQSPQLQSPFAGYRISGPSAR